ncbi:MAG: helix-turn-helix transcriptional regulator [Pseudomonadota bacterium]
MTSTPSTPADNHIGRRIRNARIDAAMTQSQLADYLGCSSQQVHKYESGSNRVSAGTLFVIARVLDHPLDWFFIDADTHASSAPLLPYSLN